MAEADIVTLAIECKSRNAESSLNAFNQKLNQSSTLAGEVMKNLGLAFGSASVIAYMKRAAAASMAFNRELYNIKSIASELDLSKVRSELLSLDSRLGSAADNAGALYFAYSSGVRGTEKELVKFTGEVGKLSQAIVADQIPTMDAVTSIMNAYGKTASDVTEISDMFFQVVKQGKTTGSSFANTIGSVAGVAANAGVSLNELGAAAATLTTTMPTERAITSLSALITAFIKPTDEATKVAQKYGIELNAAALKSKGLSGVMAELNSKVGTNTEAIAQIVPSIEGMRAAVALAGGQYKMFADNMEIFEDKAGSSAEAFAAQAENLDKQIASLPDTFNKISIQVGESAKNILTLNGTLTPLLASFNNMDKSTQKLIADLTLLAGGYVTVKGAVAAINTIKTIQLALQAKATAATAADTVATGANTTALNAQNVALAQQIALINQRTAALARGRNIPVANATLSDLANARTNEEYAQTRFNQHQANRYRQLEATHQMQLYDKLSRGGTMMGTSQRDSGLKQAFSGLGKTTGNVVRNTKQLNKSLVDITRTKAVGFFKDTTRFAKDIGSNTATLGKHIVSLNSWGNGLKSVTGLLTGGATGLAGFASALGNIGLIAGVAEVGWNVGKWINEQTVFGIKIGDKIQGAFDFFTETFSGLEYGALDRQRQAEANAEKRQKEKEKEALEKAAKDQEKAAKDQLKAAAQQEKNADIKALNETVNKYRYSKLSIQEQIQHDKGRINSINIAYGFAESTGNAKRQNELLKEKAELLDKIKTNEEKLNDLQLELNNIYDEQALIGADSAKRLAIFQTQQKEAQAALVDADKKNLMGRDPQKYLSLVNRYNSINEKIIQEKEKAQDKEIQYYKESIGYEKSVSKKRALYQDYFNQSKAKFEKAVTLKDREKAFGEMKWAQGQIESLRKQGENFAKGLQTAFQAVEYGTAQAAQAESRRYYKSAADEYAKKSADNTTAIRNGINTLISVNKEMKKALDKKESFIPV